MNTGAGVGISFAMPSGRNQGQPPPPTLLFYSFGAEFHGADEDFFVSLDDSADIEIDSAAIYGAGSEGIIKPQRK